MEPNTPQDFSMHPCFDPHARHLYGRVHLPVAPKCNVQCNYCNRKFDCASESRPGVSSAVLKPYQALAYLDEVVERDPKIAVVGIAGPGDPFANPKETIETLRLVREKYPDMLLCVSSNGLNIEPYLDDLAELGVSHVTITINAVDPAISAQMYSWMRDNKVVLRGEKAAALLIERQLAALEGLRSRGILAKVNTIVTPGINDNHVSEVAKVTAEHGASIMNCISLIPVDGTPFAIKSEPDGRTMARVRLQAQTHIKQMSHCARCRADAVGLLGKGQEREYAGLIAEYSRLPEYDQSQRPNVAVASHEGLLVNMHLGEAEELLIYAERGGTYHNVARRLTPPKGGGDKRWTDLADSLQDCRAVLCSAVGLAPRKALEAVGIEIIEMSGMIQDGLDVVYRGADPIPLKKRVGGGCNGAGNGGGC
jgi:nitrogen fixation protein NifB